MNKILLIFFLTFTISFSGFSQIYLKGVVVDSETDQPLNGANVVIKELNRGISTNENGKFEFENLSKGDYILQVSFVGYYNKKIKFYLDDTHNLLEIKMIPSSVEMEKVIISATLTERKIEDLPGQNEVIEQDEIDEFPSSNTDNILQSIANINVNRSWGIFSKNASVTMRGFDAAQGVLILYNGVPLNKTAGGSIN